MNRFCLASHWRNVYQILMTVSFFRKQRKSTSFVSERFSNASGGPISKQTHQSVWSFRPKFSYLAISWAKLASIWMSKKSKLFWKSQCSKADESGVYFKLGILLPTLCSRFCFYYVIKVVKCHPPSSVLTKRNMYSKLRIRVWVLIKNWQFFHSENF